MAAAINPADLPILGAIRDPGTKQIFGLTPTSGGNDSGKPARAALVSKLKASTPGRHTEAFGAHGDKYITIFFPKYSAAPYEGDTSIIGLDNNWWKDFSVAALCQAMYNLTHDLRKQLKKDDINNAVNGKNNDLKTRLMPFYAKVFCESFLKTPYGTIQDKTTGKAQYVQALTSDAWVTAKKTQALEQQWTDAAWELYHHFVKLHLLGASNGEIDGVINQLSGMGLLIPPEVGPGNWPNYLGWMDPAVITAQDIQGDAANGILRSESMPNFSPYGGSSSMKEENSFEFTANGQPGSKYRHSGGGGGSCFTGETKVLMANGNLLPIRSVEVGEEVFTLQGPRRVAVVSTPTRKKRTLFSLNGHSFRFTETHPFVTEAGSSGWDGAAFSAVSPRGLTNLVPTLSRLGIIKMEAGSTIMSVQNRQAHPVNVDLIEKHPLQRPESEDDLLYDLILEPVDGSFPNYAVGDDTIQVLVASEVPRIELAPYAAVTILKAVQVASEHIDGRPIPVNRGESPSNVPHVFQVLSPIKAMVSDPAALAMDVTTKQTVEDLLSVFVKEDTALQQTSYPREIGDAYEQIAAHHGEEIDALIDLGWRKIGQTENNAAQMILSVSLLDIIFHDFPLHREVCERLSVNVEARTNSKTNRTRYEESDEKVSSTFVRHFRRVFYFEDVDIDEEGIIELDFDVLPAGEDHPLPYTARAVVPGKLEHNYRMFEAILKDEDEFGLLRFDVRLLSRSTMQAEQNRSKTWGDADKQAFALALGKCYGDFLVKQIPQPAVRPTRPWYKCACFSK